MNEPMAGALLGGALHLYPGRAAASLQGGRPLLASLVAKGRRAQEVPGLIGAVFTLCAMGQRWVARRAVSAALGEVEPATRDELEALRAATAREQLLRLLHDWPRDLALPEALRTQALQQLRGCPLWQPGHEATSQMARLPGWLATQWLHRPVSDLLDALAPTPGGPHDALSDWAEATDTLPAQLLREIRPMATRLATRCVVDRLLDDAPTTMRHLAARMAREPQFCARPDWHGEIADTGPWTRHHDPVRAPAHNAWMRLTSRLVDVLRLADERPGDDGVPAGTRWLAHGALALPGHEGIAWAETARGLLVHWVRLDGRAAEARVLDMQVLAPTEWNFHPDGALADALARLPVDARAETRCLAVAFDPCVPFEVHAEPTPGGRPHA